MIIKAGFDPTSPDLHLGHAVLLRKLRQLQDEGHHVVMIVGDFTAKIGDPTGRNTTRPVLSDDDIELNAKTYMNQAFLILDQNKTEIRRNSEWFSGMSASDFLGLIQNFTVQQMLQRNDFSGRMEQNKPVALHEIMYPILQGYDSFIIKSDMEMGGEDQLFNLHAGRWVQKMMGEPEQKIDTVPLLIGTCGVKKMSKSLGNHIALLDEPEDTFCKTMRISDVMTEQWAEALCINLIENDPYLKKKELAWNIVAMLHGEEPAHNSLLFWDERYSKRVLCTDEHRTLEEGDTLITFLTRHGLVKSSTEGRQKIKEGGVRIDGVKASSHLDPVPHDGVVSVGKRTVVRARKMQSMNHDKFLSTPFRRKENYLQRFRFN